MVKVEPDWNLLPESTPHIIRKLLRRCLQKDKTVRLRDAGDARLEIDEALTTPVSVETVNPLKKSFLRNDRAAWSIAAVTIFVAALGWGAFAYLRRAPEAAQPVRFFVSTPGSGRLAMTAPTASGAVVSPLAVSPDGRRIAIVTAGADGKSQLWVRSLDTLAAQSLAGTEGAFQPFWSSDSRFIGFFAGGKLKKIEVSGGPPVTLCDAPDPRNGTWNRDGVIVFGPTGSSALQRVSAAGGVPTAATTLGQGENVHVRPFFLPDGQHFLYRASTGPGKRANLCGFAQLGRTEVVDKRRFVKCLLFSGPSAFPSRDNSHGAAI